VRRVQGMHEIHGDPVDLFPPVDLPFFHSCSTKMPSAVTMRSVSRTSARIPAKQRQRRVNPSSYRTLTGFRDHLTCGIPEHGLLRLHWDRLRPPILPFSCKRRASGTPSSAVKCRSTRTGDGSQRFIFRPKFRAAQDAR
jgi:hypothetical protein